MSEAGAKTVQQTLVLLGFGQVARNVAKQASNAYKLLVTTRDKNKLQSLKNLSVEPILLKYGVKENDELDDPSLISTLNHAYILVTFPPDGKSDQVYSRLCSSAKRIIYISSTSVYGDYQGIVDETTAPDKTNPRSILRLEAEQFWLEQGAIILRAPGLYDAQSGIHLRLIKNTYKVPAKSDNYISRIHLLDLARIILAAFAKPLPSRSIYLVGDLQPAKQIDVVQWLCEKLNKPLPEPETNDESHFTLTVNRQIIPAKILAELDIQLNFPSYKEGYTNCLEQCKLLNSYGRE